MKNLNSSLKSLLSATRSDNKYGRNLKDKQSGPLASFVFRYFAAAHVDESCWLQKTYDRTFQELSNCVHLNVCNVKTRCENNLNVRRLGANGPISFLLHVQCDG
jgi:hypothetical protein